MKTEDRTGLKKIFFDIIIGSSKVAYNLASHLLQQIIALPKILYSTIRDLKTRIIIKKIGHILKDDLIPLVLIAYAKNLIQKQAEAYLKKSPNPNWFSTNSLIQLSILLLKSAVSIYRMRKKIKILSRTAVLSIEAAESVNSNLKSTHPSPCIEEECSKLRFIKGTFRDLISYEATNIAITFIKYFPIIGKPLSIGLDSYHKGRYLVTATLASLEVCNRHQEEYLKQYSELALAYGMVYVLLTELPALLIQRYTGIPPIFYKAAIQQLVLIIQVLMGKYINLPRLIKKSTRNLPDPVVAYVSFVGFLFDTLLAGLKKQLPRLFKQTDTTIPWDNLLDLTKKLWRNPIIRGLKFIFLPRMLRSKQAFVRDRVIPWNALRTKIIDTIKNIEHLQNNSFLKIVAKTPKFAAKTLWLIFGTPKVLTELLLELINNPKFKNKLGDIRRELGHTVKENAPRLPSPNKKRFPLRNQQEKQDFLLSPASFSGSSHPGQKCAAPCLNFFNPDNLAENVNVKDIYRFNVCEENKKTNTQEDSSKSNPKTKKTTLTRNSQHLINSIRNQKPKQLNVNAIVKKTAHNRNKFFNPARKDFEIHPKNANVGHQPSTDENISRSKAL